MQRTYFFALFLPLFGSVYMSPLPASSVVSLNTHKPPHSDHIYYQRLSDVHKITFQDVTKVYIRSCELSQTLHIIWLSLVRYKLIRFYSSGSYIKRFFVGFFFLQEKRATNSFGSPAPYCVIPERSPDALTNFEVMIFISKINCRIQDLLLYCSR